MSAGPGGNPADHGFFHLCKGIRKNQEKIMHYIPKQHRIKISHKKRAVSDSFFMYQIYFFFSKSAVHCGHFTALMLISEQQNGHFFVVGAASFSDLSNFS